MEKLNSAKVEVIYNDKDITADISESLLSIEFNDKKHGGSDELRLELEDVDGKWRGDWHPSKGAKIEVKVGRLELVSMGIFNIDKIDYSGPPSTVTIYCMGTIITSPLRTKRSNGYDNISTQDIVRNIADRNNLTLKGDITSISWVRLTQNNQTDLAFLKDLADKTGHVFSIKGNDLIFTNKYKLETIKPKFIIDEMDISGYSLSSEFIQVKTKLKSKNPIKNEDFIVEWSDNRIGVNASDLSSNITSTGNITGITGSLQSANDGVLNSKYEEGEFDSSAANYNTNEIELSDESVYINEPIDNEEQLIAIAKSKQHFINRKKVTGRLTGLYGLSIFAGVNIKLTNMGVLSGIYSVEDSRHIISPSTGWSVSIGITKIKDND